mmetsp:Transcript_25435/g.40207  ORF Transcript_25435/g.40207 Transcript_25435/m.40207 type:complete len:260 (+) Transcript_25435:110-889(+)
MEQRLFLAAINFISVTCRRHNFDLQLELENEVDDSSSFNTSEDSLEVMNHAASFRAANLSSSSPHAMSSESSSVFGSNITSMTSLEEIAASVNHALSSTVGDIAAIAPSHSWASTPLSISSFVSADSHSSENVSAHEPEAKSSTGSDSSSGYFCIGLAGGAVIAWCCCICLFADVFQRKSSLEGGTFWFETPFGRAPTGESDWTTTASVDSNFADTSRRPSIQSSDSTPRPPRKLKKSIIDSAEPSILTPEHVAGGGGN